MDVEEEDETEHLGSFRWSSSGGDDLDDLDNIDLEQQAVEDNGGSRKKTGEAKIECPHCHRVYGKYYINKHMSDQHH